MPMTSTMPATRNAPVKDRVAPTMWPVVIGATTPIMLFKKFMIPPIVAVPPRGAIREGIDQPTGAAAASPLSATEIQRIAHTGSVVNMAPNTARPSRMPSTNTVLRAGVSA
jgi:hypothetical protein